MKITSRSITTVTMSAQLVVDQQLAFRGLRPLDPRRDLSQVADLIAEAFAHELEPGGLAALRDMRMLARVGPLFRVVARSDPMLEDVLGGYVWIEESRVVGNATLQRLDPYGNRWQLANVAVSKPYQNRGIGRALVTTALERIQERGGTWAVLQVRADNDIARGLYERLGFEPVTREVSLRLGKLGSPLPASSPPQGLRLGRPEEWRAVYDLAVAAQTAMAQWWRPVRSQQFWRGIESRIAEKAWEFLGRNQVRRWVVPGERGLAAWVHVDARRWQGIHQLAFTVHPGCRGQMEEQLVSFALAFLDPYPRWPVRVEHQGEHPEMIEALQRAGFRITRNHLTMRKRMHSGQVR